MRYTAAAACRRCGHRALRRGADPRRRLSRQARLRRRNVLRRPDRLPVGCVVTAHGVGPARRLNRDELRDRRRGVSVFDLRGSSRLVHAMTPRGTIRAHPNPVPFPEKVWWAIPDGPTTLAWSTEGVGSTEIRMDDPGGPLLCQGGASGTHATPPLLDRTVFYLLDASRGRVAADSALDTVIFRVVPGGRLPEPGRFSPRPWPWVAHGSVGEGAPFLFTVVIPTFQRRDLVVGGGARIGASGSCESV